MKSNLPRGLISDRGYLSIRIHPPGFPRLYQDGCGPDTPANRKAGAAKLARLRESIRLQKFQLEEPERRILFKEAADLFIQHHAAKLPGVSTRAGLGRLRDFFGSRYFDTITYLDANAYRWAREGKVASSTVNRELGVLRTMHLKLKELSRLRVIEPVKCPVENPLTGAPLVDERPRARRRLVSPDEMRRLLAVAHPDVARIAMGAFLTLLRRKDLRLLARARHWDPMAGELRGMQSKTRKPYTVPVGARMRALIDSTPGDHIFDFTGFRKRWAAAITLAGIPDVQLKDLRRTGARAMLVAGVDIAAVSRLLGHTTIAMTQRYVEAPDGDLRGANRKLEDLANLLT